MRTCEHCANPIPKQRGRNSQTGYMIPTKYCSDRCRRDASDQRVLPICPICDRNQVSHRDSKTCGGCRILWTREHLIDAIREYADRYGHPPSARDWNPAMARGTYRDDLFERFYEDGCWPHSNTVVRMFGTWNTAIQEAGFTPLASGHKYSDQEPGIHGTMPNYKRGCRCDPCREAMNAYNRENYQRRRAA
jgi:hypothetical protein